MIHKQLLRAQAALVDSDPNPFEELVIRYELEEGAHYFCLRRHSNRGIRPQVDPQSAYLYDWSRIV